jgi:hypothetical protein
MATQEQELITIKDAAARFAVCEKSIRRLIDKGELIPRGPLRGIILLDIAEVRQVMTAPKARIRNGRGMHFGASNAKDAMREAR